jgi:hypothetical protein
MSQLGLFALVLTHANLFYLQGAASANDEFMLFPASDPNLFFSQHNWAHQPTNNGKGTVAVSVNSGAYVKAVFTGSTTASFSLEASKPGATTHYMNVVFSIDNHELVEVPIIGNTTQIEVPIRGPTNTTHTLQLFIYNSLQSANRWNNPAKGGASLIVKGLLLSSGAKLLPPTLLPRRALFFGDSITEGVNAECTNPDPSCRGGDLCANAATKTWGPTVAAALGAEYSQVRFHPLFSVHQDSALPSPAALFVKPTLVRWCALFDT